MISEVTICNSALDILGANVIVSLDEETEEARLCRRNYPLVLADCLATHFWNFSIRRVELSELPDPPVFEFENRYALPGDCVRVIALDPEREDFKIEGKELITDADSAMIKYISNDVNPSEFSPQFVEGLAYKLASKLAYPLVQSVSLSTALNNKADQMLRIARGTDGQEGTPELLQRDEWLDARIVRDIPYRVSSDLEP